jgi:hypothetical protein
MWSIGKTRSLLYGTARVLGDVQAVSKAKKTRSGKPVAARVARRAAGRVTGKALGRMFRGL